jgi:hypothetical protein
MRKPRNPAALVPLLVAVWAWGGGCRAPERPAVASPAPHTSAGSRSAYLSGDRDLDLLQLYLWPSLEANRKQLEGRTGTVMGFGAGDIYPQIWLRDSATLVPLTRYHYPREYLTRWLEEHLAHQQRSGALYDWVAAGEPSDFPYAPHAEEVFRSGDVVLCADKNTSEADQESSAVLAAARVFDVLGDPGWLRQEVVGEPLIDRLDQALSFVRRERFDPQRGLLVNALTADWGDVSPAYGDQRAIYLDETTPRVLGLYTNALYLTACRALSLLQAAAGASERAASWRSEAEREREAIDRTLWQSGRGYYRIHLPIEPSGVPPADADRLAVGGHAVALLAGLPSPERALRLLEVVEQRHRRAGLPILSGTLLPPYPEGFFQHPILREPWTYQNGGQWDWFAGRLLLSMFEGGRAETAREQLVLIARRVRDSGGLYEWYTREGEGRGSPRYAGSAGALGRAVYEGLFGVSLGADGLRLRVRLGAADGSVRLREPASGRSVYYEHHVGPDRMEMRWRTRPAPKELRLRIPEGRRAARLRVAGEPRDVVTETVGRDRYLLVGVVAAEGELEVELVGPGSGP